VSNQTTFKSVYRPITKVIDETLFTSVLNFSGRSTSLDFTEVQAVTFNALDNIQHFIDGQIVIISNRSAQDIYISPNLIIANKTIKIRPNSASVFVYSFSRSKFFHIINSTDIEKIEEAIGLLNSSVQSLQAITQSQALEILLLKNKVQELEKDAGDGRFVKEKFTITTEQQFEYIDLQYNAIPNSISLTVGPFPAHLDEHFFVSIENNATRISWSEALSDRNSEEKIELDDIVFINYKISNLSF
jgi:hypothetical protein